MLATVLERKNCQGDSSSPCSSDHLESQNCFSDYKAPASRALHIWFCWEAYAKLHRAILLPPIHTPVFRPAPRPADTPATVSQPGLCPWVNSRAPASHSLNNWATQERGHRSTEGSQTGQRHCQSQEPGGDGQLPGQTSVLTV